MKARLYASEFKRLIDNTKRFVSTEYCSDGRMNWIYLEINAELKTIKATALDGRKISVEHGEIIESDESFSCYIKPNIPKICKSDRYVDLELRGNRLYAEIGDSIQGYVQPEGEYYKVNEMLEGMMKNKKTMTIGFDANLLKDALASIGKFGERIPIAVIDLYDPKCPIIIKSGKRGNKRNIKAVLPVNISYEQEES
jgi:DNA polymerase III sliding clamp (beta) subunit (PCNA family)